MSEKELNELTARAKAHVNGEPVLRICVEDPKYGTKRYGFFKMPSRHVVGLTLGKLEKNPVEANEFILMNCIIKEYSNIDLTKDSDFWACSEQSAPLLQKIEEKKSSSEMV